MLKKQEMVPGTVLKVKPVIKTGLPGFAPSGSDVKDHLLVTPECGGVMFASWKVTSGTILEVVQGPRRRKEGINTAIVKVCGQEIVGHVYWCELRVSCEKL